MSKLPPTSIPLQCPEPKCKGVQFALPLSRMHRFFRQHPYKCDKCGTTTTYKTGSRSDD